MSRYIINNIIKDENGFRKQATLIHPVIPITENDTYITTTSPDRLDKLAYTFYEDESLWWVIATANGLGKGTLSIPANVNLRIPAKRDFTKQVIQANTR
jgi:hypothetical protein